MLPGAAPLPRLQIDPMLVLFRAGQLSVSNKSFQPCSVPFAVHDQAGEVDTFYPGNHYRQNAAASMLMSGVWE